MEAQSTQLFSQMESGCDGRLLKFPHFCHIHITLSTADVSNQFWEKVSLMFFIMQKTLRRFLRPACSNAFIFHVDLISLPVRPPLVAALANGSQISPAKGSTFISVKLIFSMRALSSDALIRLLSRRLRSGWLGFIFCFCSPFYNRPPMLAARPLAGERARVR